MRRSLLRYVSYAGVIIAVFGVVFHLQGQGVVGPEASFMYKSQDWITLGVVIAMVGAVIVAASTIIKIRRV
ncbi:MAG: hypothetical protein F4W68_07415 [Cenarchaeum sp. SB0661_bin_35]|nr:hypothetical protein [Cenarchaeum sp. SB0667_bin_13]MXZ93768.1 hypothetical protein [Cenarchaeum sp. SB0666_bin_15]MYC80304.1 hypothetical protein [Cenarchaeum sp. SB0661_bin_35]MYD58738.1 hypothetical protein [Cenarchaeum sp. SB0678_bin_8]MYI52023.1 hypothetical protein [Cenarchaeum sp. SB0673_bin_9]MYJ27513.1 hypothetical protein [Cenarchaeum sp. SB0672_bin_9]